jgi:nucleotide-binding universal stress UspA family protein
VRANPALDRELEASTSRSAVALRQEQAATALLARIVALGAKAGITIQTELLTGEIAQAILGAAYHWPADLLVVGKSRRAATGEPYVGSETRSVLEFGEQPVLVVPAKQPASHPHFDTYRTGRHGSRSTSYSPPPP